MPLSYLVYPSPEMRPFSDIDLFIAKEKFEAAKRAFLGLGYAMPNAISGEYASGQQSFEKTDAYGVEHVFDVHWTISNPLVFSGMLTFEEARRSSIPVPAIDPLARTLCFEQALLLACVHRVAHHAGEQRPAWLEDIHRLAGRMGKSGLEAAVCLAKEKKMWAVVREGLAVARDRFGTELPAEILDTPGPEELSAAYLKPGPRRWRDFYHNLQSLPKASEKLRYLREISFPSPAYMKAKYGIRVGGFLPIYYVHRGLGGITKLFTLGTRQVKIYRP